MTTVDSSSSGESAEAEVPESPPPLQRRGFLGASALVAMAGGLLAGYGTFLGYAGRFLYRSEPAPKGWMFVTELAKLSTGASMLYRAPNGAPISVTHQGEGEAAEDFIALSTVCPHLGCQVHWEPQNDRYFCPCHNGVFDSSGVGTLGPPKGQLLERYPLKIEGGLLYIQVSVAVASTRRSTAGKDERSVASTAACRLNGGERA